MDETKATARLPGLDIELKRRVDEQEGAEYVSVTLRATPSLDAFAGALHPMALPLALWQSWFDMAQAFWQPFLSETSEMRRLPKQR
jgi:hypothetical protein